MEQQVYGAQGSVHTLGSISFQGLDGWAIVLKDPTFQVQVAVAEVQAIIATGRGSWTLEVHCSPSSASLLLPLLLSLRWRCPCWNTKLAKCVWPARMGMLYGCIVIWLWYPMRITRICQSNVSIFQKYVCQSYCLMWMNHLEVSRIFKNVLVYILFDLCWSSCYVSNIIEPVLLWISGTSVAIHAYALMLPPAPKNSMKSRPRLKPVNAGIL